MKHRPRLSAVIAIAVVLVSHSAWAQPGQLVQLSVSAGRPLRVVLDHRVTVKHAGQPVAGVLLDPLYAYDRVVVPKGTRVTGHIETVVSATKKGRTRAILGGDLTPPRLALLQFDTLELSDGRTMKIRTVAVHPIGREPGKMDRFKDYAIRALPIHPTFMGKGTVYSAALVEPLSFGEATPAEVATPGTAPAPASMLKARLLTGLDSSTAKPGARVDAVLTEPVFGVDKRLILPEGSALVGEVTFAKRARWFRRNGQLRFLFSGVRAPEREPEPMKAALVAVETSNLSVDEEGGATIKNSKARFIAPGLAALALAGSLHSRIEYDTDGLGPEMAQGGAASGAVGGFLGLSAAGIGVSMLGASATTVMAGIGVVRTIYSTFISKGREVSFPPDTALQLELAPRPGSRTP